MEEEIKSLKISSNDAQTSSNTQTSRNPSPERAHPASPRETSEPQMDSTHQNDVSASFTSIGRVVSDDDTITAYPEDPYALREAIRGDITKRTLRQNHSRGKVRKVKKYYNRQNALIDAYLGSLDEEAQEVEDNLKNGGKVKFAVYGSSTVNFFLFVIQLYAAVSTGSVFL